MTSRIHLFVALACAVFLVARVSVVSAQDGANGEGDEAGAEAEAEAESGSGSESGSESESESESESGSESESESESARESAPESASASESDADADELPPPGVTVSYQPEADPEGTSRLILPPYFHERRGDVSTTVLFPLFANRSSAHDHQLLVGPYFQRRGITLNADVLFPVFWSFRGTDSLTWVVPPVYSRTRAEGFDFGIAPLVFTGRKNESVYTIIPPLLTVSWASEDHARTFSSLFWRIRDHENEDWGIFPILWTSNHDTFSRVISPLYLNFRSEENESDLTIIPPLLAYHRETPTSAAWGFAPLLLHSHDETSSTTTVPALLTQYHHTEEGATRLITPLFGFYNDAETNTLITPLYQRHRGATHFDGIAPLFFTLRDPREYSSTTMITPLFWHNESPAGASTYSPLFVHVGETGRFDTYWTPLFAHYRSHERDRAGTWILPNIEVSHTEQSSTFNIHPLVYETTARTHRHFVFAPLVWNFENDRTDTAATVIAPLFWRFRSQDTVSQLALNTYWHESRTAGVHSWEFHFFPFFAIGENGAGNNWWNVLYGLVGYNRHGSYARMQILYIPFQVDGPSASEAPSVAPAQVASDSAPSRFN